MIVIKQSTEISLLLGPQILLNLSCSVFVKTQPTSRIRTKAFAYAVHIKSIISCKVYSSRLPASFIEWSSKVKSFPSAKDWHCSREITKSLIIPAMVWSMLLWSYCPRCYFSHWCCTEYFVAFSSFCNCLV